MLIDAIVLFLKCNLVNFTGEAIKLSKPDLKLHPSVAMLITNNSGPCPKIPQKYYESRNNKCKMKLKFADVRPNRTQTRAVGLITDICIPSYTLFIEMQMRCR